MLATCAIDQTVALWDTRDAGRTPDSRPIPCGNKDMQVGKLYSVAFYQSSPWLVGCGGSGNQLALWNLASEKAFKKRFGDRISDPGIVPEGETEERTEDFEAMMLAADKATEEAKKKSESKKKKGKGKSKKKAHKKR